MREPNPAGRRLRSLVLPRGVARRFSVIARFAAWNSLLAAFRVSLPSEGASPHQWWFVPAARGRAASADRSASTFPQLTVLGTVARTAPTREILEGEAWCPAIAIRRRADGGYTVAHGGSFLHSLTPNTFRYVLKFWPAFRQGHDSIRVRLGSGFLRGTARTVELGNG